MGRRSHLPEPALQRQVETMSGYGVPEAEIAQLLKIDPKTLRKHYSEELRLGHTKANAQVAGFLFNSARSGNVTAQIFWLKTRARWREQTDSNHLGVVANMHVADTGEARRIIHGKLQEYWKKDNPNWKADERL